MSMQTASLWSARLLQTRESAGFILAIGAGKAGDKEYADLGIYSPRPAFGIAFAHPFFLIMPKTLFRSSPMNDRIAYQGFTFDDVLLEPGFSEILPRDVDVRTKVTRNIQLNIPILSSPMDTVTESELAIALAQEGGMGIIHKNMSVARQTTEVDKVKRSENGIITDPITLPPDETVSTARQIMEQYNISGVPITVNGYLRGILTRRDLRFLTDLNMRIEDVMTKDNLVTATENTTLEAAERILTENKVEKLLLVDDKYKLKGLITIKDIDKLSRFPTASKDQRGRLRVGAAVGVGDYERADSLIAAGVDVLVVDSAHGHTGNVIQTVKEIKARYPEIDLIAGNIATKEGAKALMEAGADAIKVGIGPGCFAAGTRVLMADATYRNIEEVRPGDRVINAAGKPVTVVKAWCTGFREVMAIRHTDSFRETLVTPDHRYFVGDMNTMARDTVSSQGYAKVLEKPTRLGASKLCWKEVGLLDQDALLLPLQIDFELPAGFTIDLRDFAARKQKQLARYRTEISDSYELGYVFGTFLGDGHAFRHAHRNSEIGNVTWYFGLNEEETANKLIESLKHVTGVDVPCLQGNKVLNIRFYSLQWARIFSEFGKRDEKHLPARYWSGNPEYLRGLLDGLLDSDGHIDDGGRLCFRNTSPRLVELFNVLCCLVEGSFPNTTTAKASAGGLKGTCEENCRVSFRSRLNVSHRKRHLREYQVVKLLSSRQTGLVVPVYDIEVDCPTHSFIADNAIVHNSICTTRVVSGVGVPQVTAIYNASQGIKGTDIPCIADGGIRYSGDVTKALAAGAHSVMLGGLLAGLTESPGQTIIYKGRSFKTYRGMGSLGAMGSGSSDRYRQSGSDSGKLVPEGVEGRVPYKGPLGPFVYQLVGGLRAGMGYCGTRTIEELRTQSRFILISGASVQESHPHDIVITHEAPNYSSRFEHIASDGD
jgi:IMP dehydrogenase/GMP reductase